MLLIEESDAPIETDASETNARLLNLRRRVGGVPPKAWKRVVDLRDPTKGKAKTVNRCYLKFRELSRHIRVAPSSILLLGEAPGGFAVYARQRWPFAKVACQSLSAGPAFDPRAPLPILCGDGDLLKAEVRDAVCKAGRADVVSCDAAKEPINPDLLEQESLPLLLAQVLVGLRCQKAEGSMFVKVFQGGCRPTQDVVCLLGRLYKSVTVTKPVTSRCANTERYIVCIGLKSEADAARCVEEIEACSLPRVAKLLPDGASECVRSEFEAISRRQCEEVQAMLDVVDEVSNPSTIVERAKRESDLLDRGFTGSHNSLPGRDNATRSGPSFVPASRDHP